FKPLGVELTETKLPKERSLLGISGTGTDAGFVVKTVYEQEAAQWVGIAPNDILIAIDGVRVKNNNLSEILNRYAEGDEMLIHAFRDDALLAWQMLLGKEKTIASTVELKPTALGKAWLNGKVATKSSKA
ncbi:MAG: PDZ domain-containing protein, partial [Sutterellaceae bacterium]|nr:PDZ domain-containing protein [Sutterellaceae bacterium]